MVVADDLHLDMAGVADQALDINPIAAEGRHGLGLAARVSFLQQQGIIDDPHAAAAAAGNRLDHDGAALTLRFKEGSCLLQAARAAGALDDGNPAVFCQRLGLRLVAEQVERIRRRADEDDAFLDTAPGQRGVLAEEAVTGMNGVASGRLGGSDHRLDVEIGPRAAAGDFVGRVCGADMHRLRIVGGMDRDGGEPGIARRARDTDGDLAAVGDQKLVERHGRSDGPWIHGLNSRAKIAVDSDSCCRT